MIIGKFMGLLSTFFGSFWCKDQEFVIAAVKEFGGQVTGGFNFANEFPSIKLLLVISLDED